jgi:hypothetical protein
MTRKKDNGLDKYEFAQRVVDGRAKARAGQPSPEKDRDVRRVIAGLEFIDGAVNRRIVTGPEFGANDALAVVRALMTGEDHPVWKYLDGIRSESQHAPLNSVDAKLRYMIVGLGLAYQEAAKCSRAEAFKVIAHACRLPDQSFDAKLIDKSWLGHSRKKYGKGERAPMNRIRWYKNYVRRMADTLDSSYSLSDRILEAGRWFIWKEWSVPFFQDDQSQT